MRIAIIQIDYNLAYAGIYGYYTREPIQTDKPLIGELTAYSSTIDQKAQLCETKYLEMLQKKIEAIFQYLECKSIDLIVFPEYSIHPQVLPVVKKKSTEIKCNTIAASHSVQSRFADYYAQCGLSDLIKAEFGGEDIKKNCCPIFLADGSSQVIFKQHQSKWENNLVCDDNKKTVIICNEPIDIHICIDGLVLNGSSKLLVCPASSPTIDTFYDIGRERLSKELVTVFCNPTSFGGTTIFCSIPKSSNSLFANDKSFMPLNKGEEAIYIVDIDIDSQYGKKGSVKTVFPAKVVGLVPIFYNDSTEPNIIKDIESCIEKGDIQGVIILGKQNENKGLIGYKNTLFLKAIEEGNLTAGDIKFYTDYIFVPTQSLDMIRFELLKDLLHIVLDQYKNKPKSLGPNGLSILQELSTHFELLSDSLPFSISTEEIEEYDDSHFHDRNPGIQLFRDCISKMSEEHIVAFIITGMKGIGKNTLVKKLGKIFYFNRINVILQPNSSLDRVVYCICNELKIKIDYIDCLSSEASLIAKRIAEKLIGLPKTVLVIHNAGFLFQQKYQEYNEANNLLVELCKVLDGSRIKIILLADQRILLPSVLHLWVKVCRLNNMDDLYIRRIIEESALATANDMMIPEITNSLVEVCYGNPLAAKLLGVQLSYLEEHQITFKLRNSSQFNLLWLDQFINSLALSKAEVVLLDFVSVYRLPVKKVALIYHPAFSEDTFNLLIQRFFLEEYNDDVLVPGVIREYFMFRKPLWEEQEINHRLAANYYSNLLDSQVDPEGFSLEKAEYIYHSSYFAPQQSEKEIRYYKDDILEVAIDLYKQNKTRVALGHFNSIEKWSEHNYKYHFYKALCYTQIEDLEQVETSLIKAMDSYKGTDKMWIKCAVIDRLIGVRQFAYAESLIMETLETDNLPQLRALLIKLNYYRNPSSRGLTVRQAVDLSKQKYFCKYTSKILVQIFMREELYSDAKTEIKKILDIIPEEDWFKSVDRRLSDFPTGASPSALGCARASGLYP